MDRQDIAHITLWFLSNYSLLDFMNEDRFMEIYKNQIGTSRRQLQYAQYVRERILNIAKVQFKEAIKEKPKPKLEEKQEEYEEKPKPKPKEYIELEEKPKPKIEEEPKGKEMKEKIREVKPSLRERVRAFIKRVFRI